MKPLRIAIEPGLAARHGPEIHWAWRLLLVGLGWAWEEVPIDGPSDVAYVTDPARVRSTSLCIRANPSAWAEPAAQRYAGVRATDGLVHLVFTGESSQRSGAVTVESGRAECSRDIIFDLFWLATGQEEQHLKTDKHGFFDLAGTAILHDGLIELAVGSQIVGWVKKILIDLRHPPPLPRWPAGKRAAMSATHDVDYPEVKRCVEALRIVSRLGLRGVAPAFDVVRGRRDTWNFARWVDLERSFGTRSAFYFTSRQGSLLRYAAGTPDPFYDITSPRFRRLFEYLSEANVEIGLHASYHAYRDRSVFAAERQKLEEASGQQILGNRHHYWHLNPRNVEETLLLHEQVGFLYDMSLSHEFYMGWRRGLAEPFFPFDQAGRRQLKTMQLPTAWMDSQLFRRPVADADDRFACLKALVTRTADRGGCLVVDVHDYVFDARLFPGWMESYRRLLEYVVESGDFWLATPAEIARHWSNRYDVLHRESRGLES